jgi:hypothetical protein
MKWIERALALTGAVVIAWGVYVFLAQRREESYR